MARESNHRLANQNDSVWLANKITISIHFRAGSQMLVLLRFFFEPKFFFGSAREPIFVIQKLTKKSSRAEKKLANARIRESFWLVTQVCSVLTFFRQNF